MESIGILGIVIWRAEKTKGEEPVNRWGSKQQWPEVVLESLVLFEAAVTGDKPVSLGGQREMMP